MRNNFINKIIKAYHILDFLIGLPLLSKLPFAVAYPFAELRGRVHGMFGIDWRNVAFAANLSELTTASLQQIFPEKSPSQIAAFVRERYAAQALEEFEARLVVAGRLPQLTCTFSPNKEVYTQRKKNRGLIMLTPHFGSFFVGYGFLCQLDRPCSGMSSSVTNDPRVVKAVQNHYFRKYRSLEKYMNGGRIHNFEEGLRPYYQMLKQQHTLLILADLPPSSRRTAAQVDFLGAKRAMAGGMLRMARQTNSDIGSYVCRHLGGGRYRLDFGPISSCLDPSILDNIYRFFSAEILESPGHWWAADLLQSLPELKDTFD